MPSGSAVHRGQFRDDGLERQRLRPGQIGHFQLHQAQLFVDARVQMVKFFFLAGHIDHGLIVDRFEFAQALASSALVGR